MIIVGNSLKQLIKQFHIVDDENAYDGFSITLSLCKHIKKYDLLQKESVTYEEALNNKYIKEEIITEKYELKAHTCILACSKEEVYIPPGYIGFIQTKGSLARLFISAHCSDGQIEAGFKGRITFELCNMGSLNINFMEGAPIAQLFLFKTTSKQPLYNGKYKESDKPTHYKR